VSANSNFMGILLFVLLLVGGSAFESAYATPSIRLTQEVEHKIMGLHISILEDKSNSLTFDDLHNIEIAGLFRSSESEIPNFGYSNSTFWVKFRLINPETKTSNWFVELDYSHMDSVVFYSEHNGKLAKKISTGDLLPFNSRAMTHRNFVFPISIAPNSEDTYYLQFQSRGTVRIPLHLWSQKNFHSSNTELSIFHGGYFGIILVMAIYNLVLFSILKDRSYLFYIFFITFNALANATFLGFTYQFLWPENPYWANCSILVFGTTFVIFGSLFTQSFLDTKRNTPILHKVLWGIIAISLLQAPILFTTETYSLGVRISSLTVVLFTIVTLFTGAKCWLSGIRTARFFTIASGLYLCGMFTWHLSYTGILPVNIFTSYGQQIGSMLEVTLMSLGLADRFNAIKENAAKVEASSRISLEEKVTERTRDLTIAKKEAEDAIQAKSQFLATASHDLRQPLHAACLLGGLISKKARTPEDQEIVASLNHSLNSLSDLFSSLLDVSRLDAGILDVNSQSVRLLEIFDTLTTELSESLQNEGITLKVKCQDITVNSDPLLLTRILRNLLTNAIVHSDCNKILLVGKRYQGEARVIIMDNGKGIPDNEIENIFKEFYRTKSKKSAGLGLGLAIVMKLCSLLGHNISTRTSLSKGMAFTITLPLLQTTTIGSTSEPHPANDNVKITPHKLLVIDDDQDILDAMSKLLDNAGYHTRPANSFQNAKSIISEGFTPDIIICDYHLNEDITGLEVLNTFLKILPYPVRRLMLTGDTGPDMLEKIKASQIPCLHKPVNVDKLMVLLQKL